MGKVTPMSNEELKKKASDYDDLKEFRLHEPSAYVLIHRRGLMEEYCGHMKRNKRDSYSEAELREKARPYHSRKEFRSKDRLAYFAAIRHGVLDKICSHMKKSRMINGYWTKERCHIKALDYITRMEFKHGNLAAYQAAKDNGWLNEVCSHMIPKGNWFKRKVYVFTFSDGYAYVGLTQDPTHRLYQHTFKEHRSPVFKHIEETGATYDFKLLTDWIDMDKVGKVEDDYINQYASEGWKMLNSRNGGGLGAPGKLIYTDKRIWLEIKKYEYIEDFREGSRLFYNYIRTNHLFDKYCSHMKSRKIQWTLERAIEVIPECKDRKELKSKYSTAYKLIKDAGLLDKYYPVSKMILTNKKFWTLEESVKVVPLCKTRTELMKRYRGAYNTLRKAGVLDELMPTKKALPEDIHFTRIAECKCRKELQRRYNGTYAWAKRNGLLDKFFPK